MALNFQLLDKISNTPQSLSLVDEMICKECLNVEVHPNKYGGDWNKSKGTFNWFDSIGFQIASGKTLEESDNSVRNYYKSSEIWQEELPIIEKIIDYLQSKYTAKNWVSWGK
jgi:hypothetical protein